MLNKVVAKTKRLIWGEVGVGVAIAADIAMTVHILTTLFFAKKRIGVWTHLNTFMTRKLLGYK